MRREMGAAARQRVIEGFTEDHIVASMTSLYQKLLREEGKATNL